MAASADSVRVTLNIPGKRLRRGEIRPTGDRRYCEIVCDDGSRLLIDKPNLCRLIEARP